MPTIYEIRRDNLRIVVAQRGATSVAKACGYNGPSYISQMAGRNPTRPITEDNARKFEVGLGLTKGWLDIERDNFGNPLVGNAHPPVEREAPIPLNMVDVNRFTEVATLVRDLANERKAQLTPAKFTEIVSLVYEDFSKTPEAMRNYAKRLISLI